MFTTCKKRDCLVIDQVFNLHDSKAEQLKTIHLVQQSVDPVVCIFMLTCNGQKMKEQTGKNWHTSYRLNMLGYGYIPVILYINYAGID